MSPAALFIAAIPALFVLLWSTGWIAARFAAEHVEPLTFLSIRNLTAFALVAAYALAARAAWPRRGADWAHSLISGVLSHAIYLGGVWWAVKQGLPTAVSGLIAALQPLLATAFAAPLAGERVSGRQWLGVAIGLAGVALVLWPKLAAAGAGLGQSMILPVIINVIAMIGVTAGTFYQKIMLKGADLRSLTALQLLGAFLATGAAALVIGENLHFPVTAPVLGVLAWSVIVLSIFAWGLMMFMIRQGAVSKVSALVYLVPPTVAVQAWLMFGETLLPVQLAGMAVTAAGVFLATRSAAGAR